MAGRSGGRPMPPQEMNTSLPSNSFIGQYVPNGPRNPMTSPTLRRPMALVTLPTKRTLWPIWSDRLDPSKWRLPIRRSLAYKAY